MLILFCQTCKCSTPWWYNLRCVLVTLAVSRLFTRADGLWWLLCTLKMVRLRLWCWLLVLSLQERVMVFCARRTVSWLRLLSRQVSHLCRLCEQDSSLRRPGREKSPVNYCKLQNANTLKYIILRLFSKNMYPILCLMNRFKISVE